MSNTDSTWILQALDTYEGPLLRYAARLLGDRDAAKDVVQETFLELCKAKQVRDASHLAPWLYRVCRNRIFDIRRKDKRVQPLSEEQSRRVESPAPSPEAAVEHLQGAQTLVGLVKTLPESQREVVYLRFQSGLSYREISEVTGHSVSNVGVLIHTAVRRIRDMVASKGLETALERAQ